MKVKLYILLLLVFLSSFSFGQELRENDIREATNFLSEGRFDDVISTLKNKNFEEASKQIRAEAYKLLSAAYYEIDELEKADTATIAFLELKPLYRVNNTSDPEAFVRGLQRFKIYPKLNFYLMMGINQTQAYIIQQNVLSENVNYDLPYKSKMGYQLNMGLERLLFYNLYLDFGLNLQTMQYSRTLEYDNRPLSATYTLDDQMIRIEVPIGFMYKVYFRNLSLGGGIGVSALYNRSILAAKYTPQSAETKPIDALYANNNRLLYNARLNFNGRVAYQSGGIEYFVDFSYKNDLLSPVESLYMRELYYPMLYVDDDFVLTNIQLSVGISIRISYKVKNRYE